MLDFPTDSEDRTSTYDENLSKATYYAMKPTHSLTNQSGVRKTRFSFRKPNSHTQPEVVVNGEIQHSHHYQQSNQSNLNYSNYNHPFGDQPAIPYESSMAVLQNTSDHHNQPPIYSDKPSFRLSESDEQRKLQQVIRRSFVLAILSWLFCGGCFYSCLCFLPLYRKNYIFYNVENSFLDDTSSGYGLRKNNKSVSNNAMYYSNQDEEIQQQATANEDQIIDQNNRQTNNGEWKYVMKSFKGNRFRDSPYRSIKHRAESAFDCGFCGCLALNCLLMFWVVALGSSALIIVLLKFFYSGYNKM
ncbi:predicted protein [Naegleria gruberi]|uniref:Predicted protein n=1 Tax=Naegleria gruberi TaxID=5762 RepID=D2VIL8_NAEGR|nr:uncharacterized protein NAEGRDRAFT_68723 [Naegleria gruberi]EFC43293.1 predicted protein [Naegleria gruberi]|eukprot:XP_002676037.1 predicted protein [Naegleria gruberi strain NEG-M]